MKINGYQIRETIRRLTLQRDITATQFKDNLYAYEGEEASDPVRTMTEYQELDRRVALIETLQQKYNQMVSVEVDGCPMNLSLAVKLVGGAGRREKMWRDAAAPKKDRYSYANERMSRSKDTEYASRTISTDAAVNMAQKAGKYAASLRSAIAKGNTTEFEHQAFGMTEFELTDLFR